MGKMARTGMWTAAVRSSSAIVGLLLLINAIVMAVVANYNAGILLTVTFMRALR